MNKVEAVKRFGWLRKRRLSLQCAISCLMVVSMGMLSIGVIAPQQAAAQDESPEGLSGGQMVWGIATPASAGHLAIKTEKGELYQVAVTDNTRMMKDRQPVKLAAIRTGDTVGAMGILDAPNRTVHALFVMVVDAEEAKKAREGLGKVYIMGKVTAIDDLKLTILRPDGVSQVIAVDEGTSFRRRGHHAQSAADGGGPGSGFAAAGGPGDISGESVTLADIKVGDNVMGKGELKGGIFVPTQLGIGDPSTRQRRRRQEGAGPAAPSSANRQ